MSGTGFPSSCGLGDPAAWATPVQPGVPDTRQVPAEPTDAQMLDWLERNDGRFANIDRITSLVRHPGSVARFNGHRSLREAIASAMKEHP